MNLLAFGLFLLSATALLGSPGPGIASLLALGRIRGFAGSLTYLAGLLLGLAITAALCATGIFSLLALVPGLLQVMAVIAILYLLYLAYRIATSPVGGSSAERQPSASFGAGMLLGFSNPKAYIAFVSLFASQTIVIGNSRADATLKWLLVVSVIITVDLIWLMIGAFLKRATLAPKMERALNILLGGLIIIATVLSFVID